MIRYLPCIFAALCLLEFGLFAEQGRRIGSVRLSLWHKKQDIKKEVVIKKFQEYAINARCLIRVELMTFGLLCDTEPSIFVDLREKNTIGIGDDLEISVQKIVYEK